MRTLTTAMTHFVTCSECGRPAHHMVQLNELLFCDLCVTEALALLRYATSASVGVEVPTSDNDGE